ncbi:endonuclease/exonuclease/phosphatase family protein [Vibrio sp. WJH972]
MKIRIALFAVFGISLIILAGFLVMFKNTNSIELMTIAKPDTRISSQLSVSLPSSCIMQPGKKAIDNNGELNLLVWNIHKQQDSYWIRDLSDYSEGLQLLMIQESILTPMLASWIKLRQLTSTQVNAFLFRGESVGVMTIATEEPSSSCGYIELEPFIRLNKSSLVSYYPLSNGKTLAIANLHSINFTLTVYEYKRQIKSIIMQLHNHKGPVIVAGDFNDWSAERKAVVRDMVESLELVEADYAPDNRTIFAYGDGTPVDHLFYRQLELDSAIVSFSRSSDHNPIIASFSIN